MFITKHIKLSDFTPDDDRAQSIIEKILDEGKEEEFEEYLECSYPEGIDEDELIFLLTVRYRTVYHVLGIPPQWGDEIEEFDKFDGDDDFDDEDTGDDVPFDNPEEEEEE